MCVYACMMHTYTIDSTIELLAWILWRVGYQFSLWNKHIVRMNSLLKEEKDYFIFLPFPTLLDWGTRMLTQVFFKVQVIPIKGPGMCLWNRLGAFNHERE